MGSNQTSYQVLMFPWLAHGHISPFLELAKKLITRNFFIYLCSTPINLIPLKKKLADQKYSQSIKLVELNLPSVPELPPHYHTTNGLPPHLMSTLKRACNMSKPSLSNILKTLKPDLLIYDIFLQWAATVASSHNVPAVQFQTSSASMASFFTHMLTHPDVEYPLPEMYLREYEKTTIRHVVESAAREVKEEVHESERSETSRNMMLIKTLKDIEGKYINYLSVLSKTKIVPVGPLIEDLLNEDHQNKEVIEWLNKKDRSSAVFVSFGSEYFLSKHDIEEISHGLELSNLNFIWVIRFPVGETTKVEEVLPEGFIERLKERGMIVEGWAPQAKILGHSSIGGFVSHCGWNSVLESMKNGVPIVALPMQLDQPLNARLVLDVGVGLEVLRDNNGRLQREEVAKVIREVVVDKKGHDVRRKAGELSEIMREKGEEEIDKVVEELVQICGQEY